MAEPGEAADMVCNAVIAAEAGELTAAGEARIAFDQVIFAVIVKKKLKIDAADDAKRERETAAAILKLLIAVHVYTCPAAVDSADKLTPYDRGGVATRAFTDDVGNDARALYIRLDYIDVLVCGGGEAFPLLFVMDIMQSEAAAPVVRLADDGELPYGTLHIAEEGRGYGGHIRAIFIDEAGKALLVAADIQSMLRGDAQADTVFLKPAAVMIEHIHLNVDKRKNI